MSNFEANEIDDLFESSYEEEEDDNELSDFKEKSTYPLDESEERYLMRCFKSCMEEREIELEKMGVVFFDPSQIEGVLNANDKDV